MKAIVLEKYGKPEDLKLKEIDKPQIKKNQVLVKVKAAAVNAGDWHLVRAEPFMIRLFFGLFKPKVNILGVDIAGVVEETGSEVTDFQPGDRVFGDLTNDGFGGYAEYAAISQNTLAIMPDNISFQEAAALPTSAGTALAALRDCAGIKQGDKVLVNGASGGVGAFSVQLARYFKAEVTAVCSSRKVDFIKTLRPDHIIDYQKEDFTRNNKKYDIIHAANGYQLLSEYKNSLTEQGTCCVSGGTTKQFLKMGLLGPLMSSKKGKKLKSFVVKPNSEDLTFLANLSAEGSIKPLIDRTYSLDEVPQAILDLEKGLAQGKFIIEI